MAGVMFGIYWGTSRVLKRSRMDTISGEVNCERVLMSLQLI